MSNKVGSRRTGSAGIDTSTINGFLKFISGQDPAVKVYPTQAQAEAGTDNDSLMTPLRVKQAILENAGSTAVSYLLGKNAAPTTGDNASDLDDQGNAIRAGTLWQHVKTDPPTTEADVDWYRCEGFTNTGDALWHLAEQVAASVITAITNDISTLQSTSSTLVSRMATVYASVFDSPAIFAIATDQRVVELDKVPKNDSTAINSNASDGSGLFSMIEDEDYETLGNLVFLNRSSDDARSVADGDRMDINYFYNAFQPGDIADPAIGLVSGGHATITWTDSGDGDSVEIYKCASANNPGIIGSWSLLATATGADESYSAVAAVGDKFRIRRKNTDNLVGAFSSQMLADD